MKQTNQAELYAYIQQNGSLIESYLEKLGTFGQVVGGGLVRPVYSPPWLTAHRQVAEWMAEAGLEVRADAVGNLWGLSAGKEAGKGYASGSHLDTVKEGGKYDGGLGVLAALVAVRFLKELYGPPRLPLEVLALCEEEGSRFSKSFLGSRAITGTLPVSELTDNRDSEGISVNEAASACSFDTTGLAAAQRTDLAGFIELHIEQGRLLDDARLQAGIVQAITGTRHLQVTFSGQADHAGTTPMDLRSDALVAAAQAVTAINAVALKMGRPAVATVGKLSIEPGATNIVPALVVMMVDLRHSDPAKKAQLAGQVEYACREAAASQGVTVAIETIMDRVPAQMSPEIINLLQATADELGISNMPMISGAGHDSQVMVEQIPTGMIFVPSQAGRSHSRAEFTPLDQILPGVALLAQALYKLAY
jgi:allantoate deiminase